MGLCGSLLSLRPGAGGGWGGGEATETEGLCHCWGPEKAGRSVKARGAYAVQGRAGGGVGRGLREGQGTVNFCAQCCPGPLALPHRLLVGFCILVGDMEFMGSGQQPTKKHSVYVGTREETLGPWGITEKEPGEHRRGLSAGEGRG